MEFLIFIIIIFFLAAIQTAIPFLVKRTVVFGVTIPEQNIKDERLIAFKKWYAIVVSIISFLLLGGFSLLVLLDKLTEEQIVLTGTMIEFITIFISMSLYFYFYGKTVQLKKERKWGANLKQVKISDLSVRLQDEMLPWYVFLLPIIAIIGLIGYTLLQYDILPDQIPTHWGPSGEADDFTTKTPFSAITMPLVFLFILFMFLGINIGTKKSGIKLSATSTNASKIRQLNLRKYSSWFGFFSSVLLTVLLSYFQLTVIHPEISSQKFMLMMPFVILIVVFVGTILFAVKVGRSDKQSNELAEGDITDYDEDSFWKAGIIYFNPNDPSIFVEKRFGVGWTINFANPKGYLLVVVPLIIIVAISIYNS